jgi:hypothetical protein
VGVFFIGAKPICTPYLQTQICTADLQKVFALIIFKIKNEKENRNSSSTAKK